VEGLKIDHVLAYHLQQAFRSLYDIEILHHVDMLVMSANISVYFE
jgi:hypothetical protein